MRFFVTLSQELLVADHIVAEDLPGEIKRKRDAILDVSCRYIGLKCASISIVVAALPHCTYRLCVLMN